MNLNQVSELGALSPEFAVDLADTTYLPAAQLAALWLSPPRKKTDERWVHCHDECFSELYGGGGRQEPGIFMKLLD